MALRVRFQYTSGSTLGYSVERLADGLFLDFADGTFKGSAWATQVNTLAAGTGNFLGQYRDTLTPTLQANFTDGDYCVTIHNTASSNAVVGLAGTTMHGGDDAGGGIATVELDVYSKAFLRGNVVEDALGWTYYDADDGVTKRVRFNKIAAPGGRTVTLDPA